jgi:hypothetical protein
MDLDVFVGPPGLAACRSAVSTMSAAMSWFVSVVAVLGLVLALHHLGVDVSAHVGAAVRGAEHLLGQPLLPE